MAAVKALAGLLLLGCLVSAVTSSPIKDKKDTLITRPSRFTRIKTVVRVAQNQQPSSSSNGRFYPDPQSPVAHFDSSLSPPQQDAVQDQVTQQKDDGHFPHQPGNQEIFHSTDQQTKKDDQIFQAPESEPTQSLRSPGRHSNLPAITNFGDRIQKNGQDSKLSGCQVNGGCSTMIFTPDGQSSVGGITNVENNIERAPHSTTVPPFVQQEQFTAPDHPQIQDTFEFGQNKDDSINDNKNVPKFQDVEEHKNSQKFLRHGNTGIIGDQGSVQNGLIPETQFVAQQDSSDYNNGQQFDGYFPTQGNYPSSQPNRQSTSFSGLPVEQTSDDGGTNYEEQRNFEGNSQFDQSTSQGFIANVHEPQDSGVHQQVVDQSSSFDGGHQSHDDGQYHHYGNPIDWLRYNVPGNPGEDYPILYQVPQTSFNCKDQQFSAGIFGDVEASCQVFHVCKESGGQDSFLCPNGTVFNQQYFVCDWWYNFRCSDTPSFYNLNAELYWDWESFTPSQMFNVPSGNTDESYSSIQSGSQDSFGSNSGNADRQLSTGEIAGQKYDIKSTTVVDNSAIRDENREIYEQRLEEPFAQEEPVLPVAVNDFQNMQQGFYEQRNEEYPSSFTPDVRDTTRGLDLATVSPISDSRVENIPGFNDKNENNFYPASPETGANRNPEGDAGTRYRDQNGYEPQSNSNIQPHDQNRPSFDVQRNAGNSESGEISKVKYDEQQLVPVDFDNANSFRDSGSGTAQNNQNNYGIGADQGAQFDNNQQFPSGIRNNGESYNTHTQIQQEQLPHSLDGDRPQVFNPSGNVNTQSNQGSFATQDRRPPLSVTNERNNINQVQQEVQEEYIPASPFGNNPDISEESYNQQFEQNQGSLDVNQQSILRDDQSSDNRHADDVNKFSGVQQEHISSAFGSNKPDSFQNENSGIFGPQSQNTFSQDHTTATIGTDVKENFGNSRSTISSISQGNQEEGIQQEHISSSFDDQGRKDFSSGERGGSHDTNKLFADDQNEDSRSFESSEHVSPDDGSYGTRNVNGNQHSQQEHVSSFSGNNRDNVFGVMENNRDYENNKEHDSSQIRGNEFSEASKSDRDSNNNKDNQNVDTSRDVQQEYITSFDNIKPNGFDSGENIGSEIDVNDQRQTIGSFQPNDQNSFGNDGGYIQNIGGNQEIRQEHVSVPFSGIGQSDSNNNKDNQNVDTARDGQQEYITSFDNIKPNGFDSGENIGSEIDVNDQRQTIGSFQPNDQNSFGNDGGYIQNIGGNREIRQEHVSVPFSGIGQSVIGGDDSNSNINGQEEFLTTLNRGNTIHGNNEHVSFRNKDNVDRNNPQVTEQKHISNQFGENQPNVYEINQEKLISSSGTNRPNPVGSEIRGSNSFNKANPDVQQDSIFVPFDGSNRHVINPENNGGQFGGNNEEFHNNLNQGSPFEINNQNNFRNDDMTRGENTAKIPEVQQEYITSTFNSQGNGFGPQANGFGSNGNDRSRIFQNEYVNLPGHNYQNNQNNFRTGTNHQEPFPAIQTLQQENIPTSFDNNHQSNFHEQNSFKQENNQENLSQHSHSFSSGGHRSSFQTGKNGVNLNTNEAFQMRLNNFQPADIHMMHRGGPQIRNYEQQRLSFRPYGQNNQNAVIFPGGQNPVNFVSNPSLGFKSSFSNERSSSNRNFFVTNGHQVRNEHSQQQTGNGPLHNQGAANNVQADLGQHDPQHIKRSSQDEYNNGPGIVDSKDTAPQKTDITQTAITSTRGGNQNVNSEIKGHSSQNNRNGRNVNFSTSSNAGINPQGSPTVSIGTDDAVAYNQPVPESPTSANYNGWKPVVKY